MTFNLNANNNFQRAVLPQSLIYPTNEKDLPYYFMNLYQLMSTAINSRDFIYFQMAIGPVATVIPYMNNFGSYVVCVSGAEVYLDSTGQNYWPCHTYAINKSAPLIAGNTASLGVQTGSGTTLGGIDYTISYIQAPGESVANLYAAISQNAITPAPANKPITSTFNVRIIGTQ